MASARAAANRSLADFGVLIPLFCTAAAASTAYLGYLVFWRSDWRGWLVNFATGPGRTSRLLLLVLVLINLKSVPLAWTVRIFSTMLRHMIWPRPPLPRRALFHYSITSSHTSLLETDYNLHKSNSTYFSDLDGSRSHLVMYLLGPGVTALSENAKTGVIRLPGDNKPMPGNFGVGLGAVFCSFRKEIGPYQPYEMWSRVLSWDRKWFYIVTHFVVKGKVRPAGWDCVDGRLHTVRELSAEEEARLQKYVIATAISKYVFKVGRFTVHPTYLIENSSLLPERPGEGWRGGGPDAIGSLADFDETTYKPPTGDDDADWDWRRVEYERRRGMQYAQHMAALDGAAGFFDGGRNGALGKFRPG